jgi:hypothetical protein
MVGIAGSFFEVLPSKDERPTGLSTFARRFFEQARPGSRPRSSRDWTLAGTPENNFGARAFSTASPGLLTKGQA